MLLAMIADLIGRLRAGKVVPPEPCLESWRVLADGALKPDTKTRLVARAVSLRAF